MQHFQNINFLKVCCGHVELVTGLHSILILPTPIWMTLTHLVVDPVISSSWLSYLLKWRWPSHQVNVCWPSWYSCGPGCPRCPRGRPLSPLEVPPSPSELPPSPEPPLQFLLERTSLPPPYSLWILSLFTVQIHSVTSIFIHSSKM